MDRQTRLRFLLRRNRGRLMQADVLAELSAGLGRPLSTADLLPLEEGDRLREVAISLLPTDPARREPPAFSAWSESDAGALARGLAALGERLPDPVVYYLPFAWDVLGALRVAPGEVLPRAVALARGPAEECPVCSPDARDGLWLVYHASDAEHGEPHPFDLLMWGERWPALARGALPFELAARVA
jgi:hypothetical protein